ncbi:hypothetical protein DFH06DRAFT_1467435 [Mycena polygramma]|nr:hypothetical protein DFH06DRAFT_1467435 [Mycena polygramma]
MSQLSVSVTFKNPARIGVSKTSCLSTTDHRYYQAVTSLVMATQPPSGMHQLLQALEAEKTRRQSLGASRVGSPHLDGSEPNADAPRGVIRARSEMDTDGNEFPSLLLDDSSVGPYTLEEGRLYKRHKNLSGPSDADADTFLKTSNPMRHNFQMYTGILQCRDHLETTAQDWGQVAILSYDARRYRDRKDEVAIASTVVSAMRVRGIADLPPPYETGRCEVLHKVLGKAMTDRRCHIKFQVFATLGLGKPTVNIATLTRNCCLSSPVTPTLGLYQRIALIRSVAVDYLTKGGVAAVPAVPAAGGKADAQDDFWPTVDTLLASWREAFSKADMQIMFEKAYDDDVLINVEEQGQHPGLVALWSLDVYHSNKISGCQPTSGSFQIGLFKTYIAQSFGQGWCVLCCCVRKPGA